MKKLLFFLAFSFVAHSILAQDSLDFKYSDYNLKLPLRDGQVVYEQVLNFDTIVSSDHIYSKIKDAIAPLFPRPGVGYNYSFFKLNNVTNQIINEDKENKSITAHLIFKTIKNKNDNEIKPDVLVVSKARFIVRGNKLKCVISDLNIEYYSMGMAVLAGAGNSLVSFPIENALKKPKNGTVTAKGEFGKAIYSALSILENKIFGFIKGRIQSNIQTDNF
jgi:hypothetical protein